MDAQSWLSSYDPQVPHSIEYSNEPITAILEKTADRFPSRTALNFFGFTMTYDRLRESVHRFSSALNSLGVKEKQTVVLFLPNTPHFIIAYYAVLRLGAVVVPANPLYSEKELAFQIDDAGAKTVVTLDLLFSRLHTIMEKTGLERIIVGKIQDFLPPLKKIVYPVLAQKETEKTVVREENGVFFFQTLMKKKLPEPPLASPSGSDIAMLQYTGGTTGLAKGAVLTHRNITANNMQIRHWHFGMEEGSEIFISVLPFFHSYGMAVAMNLPVSVGATIILFPRFVTKDILKSIKQNRATVLPGIPSIYSALNAFKEIRKHDISSINYCISGAAPLPVTVLQEFEEKTGGVILEGYGLSEASPVTHCNPMQGKRKVGSIGLPMPDTQCRLVDAESGEPVQPGVEGELCIKGPQVMQAYWCKKEETDHVLRDGWLYTGDIARIDEEGYFYIIERKKDLIISEGFNIYPREIEEFLIEHPKIADAAVIGEPDKLRGERAIAYVVLHNGQAASPEEIIKYCKENLVKYKVPRKVIFTDSIPTTIAGKKLRRVLREKNG